MLKSNIDYVNENLGNLVLFSRYLLRTDKVRKLYEKESNCKNGNSFEVVFVYHALLYVCIETYIDFNFHDRIIDFLLGDKYANQVDVLRKMRNSIFHPDNKVFGSRQKDFINASDKIINWALVLLSEFNRFVYMFAEDNNVPELGNKIRKLLKVTIGWVPEYGLPIKVFKSKKKVISSYKYMIKNEPEKKNEYTKELNKTIQELSEIMINLYTELIVEDENILNLTTAST